MPFADFGPSDSSRGDQRYEVRDGLRRQMVNVYRLTSSVESARPHPDLRRHRDGGMQRAIQKSIEEKRGYVPVRSLEEHRLAGTETSAPTFGHLRL